MSEKAYDEIKKLWATIPAVQCKPGCHDCCGPIFMSRIEWENIEPKLKATSIQCPYVGKEGCTIYENRPTICRLFGTGEHPVLQCPKGCRPYVILTEEQSRNILKKVVRLGE